MTTALLPSAPAFDPAGCRFLRRRLLSWFDRHRRDLPWRSSRDPYRVWLSEIMLQQTRVGAVVEHYRHFLSRFPNLASLAAARPASVLAAWSGLGYYRRARALHAAARLIMTRYGGRFPDTVEALQQLPGIGRYTAAAIASIAFDRPCAVVDGNVERVLQRLLGPPPRTRAELWAQAQHLLSPTRPGDFNQAMMELGATVCLPRQPRCPECPVAGLCATRGSALPAKKPEMRQTRRVNCLLAERGRSVYLMLRPRSVSLMPGMWELPELVLETQAAAPALALKHSITNTDYEVSVVRDGAGPLPPGGRWVPPATLRALPLTGLTRKILGRFDLL